VIHLLNPTVVAELVGVDDRRTFPEADATDHYGFAAVVWSQMGWSDPWSVLDYPRDKDAAALLMLRRARGDLGDPDDVVETVHLDAEGQHVPPGADLADWTRWVWGRLVEHYFGEGACEGPRAGALHGEAPGPVRRGPRDLRHGGRAQRLEAPATVEAVLMPQDHVHVRIRRDLHHQAKVQAAVEGVSLEEWLARAIEAQLKRSRPR
jgi:hypothetical protein